MEKRFLRAFMVRNEDGGKPGDPIQFIASTEGIKRDGKELQIDNWNLDNYKRNPVFLWAHDYFGSRLPIGRSETKIENKKLMAEVIFDQTDEFARQVETKYRNKFLNAVSVGWFDVLRCIKCGYRLESWMGWSLKTFRMKCPSCGEELNEENVKLEYDLLDISGVPVPGDPDALMERELRGIQEILMGGKERNGLMSIVGEGREGRPYANEHACRLRDPGDFDKDSFARVEREHEGKKYSVIIGKLKGESTMTDQAYRYPKDTWTVSEARAHCKDHDGKSFEPAKSEETAEAVWNGIASAMLALFRENTAMEEENRKAVYILLERAYGKLGRVAPEYRTQSDLIGLGCEEIEGLFLEGEATLTQALSLEGRGERKGAVLNSRNRGDLEEAVTLIQGVLKRATKEEGDGEGGDDGGEHGVIPMEDALATLRQISNQINQIGG